MSRFLPLMVLAVAVLAQPEPAQIEIEAEAEPVPLLESDPDPDPEQEPGVEPVHLKDGPEDVVGGTVAKPNSWPWQVSLQVKNSEGYKHNCGGTLIQRDWVMTAAHCVDSPMTLRVVAGEHDLQSNSGREQFFAVSRVHIHPRWNAKVLSNGNDVALLHLSEKAILDSYVVLASLPPPGQVLPNNNLCYVTGWGRTSAKGSLSPQLKEALLPVVDYETCSRSDWWGSYVNREMVCAGGSTFSGCYGDSGGPLNCRVNGQYSVHGITSFVPKGECNTLKRPTVFIRVSAYISWMNSVMASGV